MILRVESLDLTLYEEASQAELLSALEKAKDSIIRISNEEGLTGHGNSVKIRFEEDLDEMD